MDRITHSVGNKGINKYKDVMTVQTLINDCRHLLLPMLALETDGKIGKKTISAIELFQKNVIKLSKPDGRVDPGGKTITELNKKRVVGRTPPQDSLNFENLLKSLFPSLQDAPLKFPLDSRPAQSYKDGMRRFGSNRSKGRKHAGCDLYAPVGTPIYAMDDGVVEKDIYAFYLGTYAIEIKHTKFLARYGEISRVAKGVKKGAKIKKGQLIAYVGELRGLNMSMLHLELYSGKAKGSLTVRGNKPYKRRSDLIDPTPILDKAK